MARPQTPAYQRILKMIEPGHGGCWLFTGPVGKNGYGKTIEYQVHVLAHRAMYERFKGPIPDGMQIDHICNVKRCVNPDHLQCLTQEGNMERTRKRFCKYGHDMDLYARPMGKTRRCWLCHLRDANRSRKRSQHGFARTVVS